MATKKPIKPNDKEMTAVKFNMVEQRCLKKNLAILDAEASYSLKLIDLNNRGMKIFYKRFKDKVGKIKSNLKQDEIDNLKDLDSRGLLADLIKPLNLTGALRIADAEKRLKLQSTETTRKAKSALPMRRSQPGLTPTNMRERPSTCVGHMSVDACGLPNPFSAAALERRRSISMERKFSLVKPSISLDVQKAESTIESTGKISQVKSENKNIDNKNTGNKSAVSVKSESTAEPTVKILQVKTEIKTMENKPIVDKSIVSVPQLDIETNNNAVKSNKKVSKEDQKTDVQLDNNDNKKKSSAEYITSPKSAVNKKSPRVLKTPRSSRSTSSKSPRTPRSKSFKKSGDQNIRNYFKTVKDFKFPKPSVEKNKDISRLSFAGKLPEIQVDPQEAEPATEPTNAESGVKVTSNDQQSDKNEVQSKENATTGDEPGQNGSRKGSFVQKDDQNVTITESNKDIDKKHVKISADADDSQKHSMDKRSLSRVSSFTKSSAVSTGGGNGQYSCHSLPDKKRERSNSIKSTYLQQGQEEDLFLGYLGEDPYEERRKMLLSAEERHSMDLLDRKDDFLDEIDDYIRRQIHEQGAVFSFEGGEHEELKPTTGFDIVELSRRQKRQMNTKRRMTLENRRAAELWKDVNKCRYLRVPDDKLDLSGLVLLAKDQMKLGKII